MARDIVLVSARRLFAVNSPMIKRLIPALLGLFGSCLPLFAQEEPFMQPAVALDRSIVFSAAESSSLPALTLLDQRRFVGSSAWAEWE